MAELSMHEDGHSSTSSTLQASDVSLSFGGVKVLDKVHLTINESEVVALIGPNGAGKSALLNCISGVYRADAEARIILTGLRIDGLPPYKIARMGISRTFQGSNFISQRSVLDNVLLGWTTRFSLNVFGMLARPRRARLEEAEAREKAFEVMNLCRLDSVRDEQCAALPLGILRRVDLARALMSEPRLLLLDEPASGLSHDERPIISEMVRLALRQKKLAVLWIEHDLDLVFTEAQRAIVLHHGQEIDTGDPTIESDRARLIRSYKQGRRTLSAEACTSN